MSREKPAPFPGRFEKGQKTGLPAAWNSHILPGPGPKRDLPQLWKSCGNPAFSMTEIWPAILKQIEEKLDPKELSTWFGPTRQVGFDPSAGNGLLTV